MKIITGADHGGFDMKEELRQRLAAEGYEVYDAGTSDKEEVDYPDIAETLCRHILAGDAEKGILVCGTGIGMSIAANKVHGIRAALVTDTYSARMAAAHNHANVIALGARTVGIELAWEMVKAYLNEAPLEGKHSVRVDKIMALEAK